MALEFRICQPGDEERLAALDAAVNGGQPSTPDFWTWKYFANPAGPACVALALEGERLVGKLGSLPVRARIDSREFIASQQTDNDILPEYRKGGTYFQLAQTVRDEGNRRKYGFAFGFATDDTTTLSVEVLGFSRVGSIGRWVKVLDYERYLKRWLGPVGRVAGPVAGRVMLGKMNGAAKAPGLDAITRFDERFDDLADRLSLGAIRILRDSAYLNWRYVDCPTVDYGRYAVESDGKLRGFVIFHPFQVGDLVRGIVDELVCPPEDEGVLEALLSAATADLVRQGAANATCWLPGWHPLGKSLRHEGFRPREARTSLIVARDDPETGIDMDELSDEGNWYYTLGDSDYHVQPGA